MSPDYAKLVTTPEFFGPSGTMPLMTVSPIPQPISREEIHVKSLSKELLENELERFLKYLAQTYKNAQVIDTVDVGSYVLLVYSIPRQNL